MKALWEDEDERVLKESWRTYFAASRRFFEAKRARLRWLQDRVPGRYDYTWERVDERVAIYDNNP